MRFFERIVPCALVLLMALGCGGSSGITNSAPEGGTITSGSAKITFTGRPASQIAASGQNVIVTGLAGAAFTGFTLNPPKTLANTAILYPDGNGNLFSYANGVQTPIGGIGLGAVTASWTYNGSIVYAANTASGIQLFLCNYDGSNPRKLTSTNVITYAPVNISWSPTNNVIAFDDGNNSIYTCSTSGASVALKVSGGLQPSISPDGTKIAFSDGSSKCISTIASSGGSLVNVTPTGTQLFSPCWSPDGKYIVAENFGTGIIEVYASDGSGQVGTIPIPGTYPPYRETLSPDGSQIAYGSSTGTGYALYEGSITGLNTIAITAFASPSDQNLSWSPYPGPQNFVGPSGTVEASVSGILWSQNGDAFGGFAGFVAKTPSTATITQVGSNSGTAPLVFDAHADSITAFRFTNGFYSAVNSIATGGLSDVLVSVSTGTGNVTSIAPFVSRSLAKDSRPLVAREGEVTVCRGQFAGLWNGKGKNLCPSGLTEIRLDSKGQILSYR